MEVWGSGPLQGWTLEPAGAARERTARGMLLKYITLDATNPAEAREWMARWGQRLVDALLERLRESSPAREDPYGATTYGDEPRAPAKLIEPTPEELAELQARAPRDYTATVAGPPAAGADDPPREPSQASPPPFIAGGGEASSSPGELPLEKLRGEWAEAIDHIHGPAFAPEPVDPEAEAALRATLEAAKSEAAQQGGRLDGHYAAKLLEARLETPPPGSMCCLCLRDIFGAAHSIKLLGSLISAHPECLEEERRRLVALPAAGATETPAELCPTRAHLWRIAHDARDIEAKPKRYRGDSRVGCELCQRPVQKGQPAVPKRSGSSKWMHATCRDQTLANPNQPPTPPTATE